MPTKATNALSKYRRQLKRGGIVRVEMNRRKDDAALIRGVVKALNDPGQRSEVRALLRDRFATGSTSGLKALLAAAPLEGIDLERDRDFGETSNFEFPHRYQHHFGNPQARPLRPDRPRLCRSCSRRAFGFIPDSSSRICAFPGARFRRRIAERS